MKKYSIGLQLYSVYNDVKEDMEGTLKKVAEMGYDCVEITGYHDHSAEEIKAMCEKYNLEPISVHQPPNPILDEPDTMIPFLKALGVQFSAIPWMGEWETNFEENIAKIKQVGKLLKENGIQLLYHNHDFELTTLRNGVRVLDAIFEKAGDVLAPELDLCWVHYAGCDPVEYIKKYGDKEELIHIKDFECKNLNAGAVYALVDEKGNDGSRNKETDGFEFRPIGYGRQDIKALFEAMEDTNIKYVIVEQDAHPTNTPLEDAKISIDYIRSLGY